MASRGLDGRRTFGRGIAFSAMRGGDYRLIIKHVDPAIPIDVGAVGAAPFGEQGGDHALDVQHVYGVIAIGIAGRCNRGAEHHPAARQHDRQRAMQHALHTHTPFQPQPITLPYFCQEKAAANARYY